MCRYADHPYRTHFACLDCRFTSKHHADGGDHHCPTCRAPMIDMGRDFKPPRKADDRQWAKLRLLVERGILFNSCGCTGPGPRPRTLGEARHPLLG